MLINLLNKVYIDPIYNWNIDKRKSTACFFKGWFESEGFVYSCDKGASKIAELFSEEMKSEEVERAINSLKGNFGFILITTTQILASVDKVRSYPIFYSIKDNVCSVSNSARLLQREKKLYQKDENSFLEFKMAGYVSGPKTLFKGLFQIQAGECFLWNEEQNVKLTRYFRYCTKKISSGNEKQLIEELYEITLNVFRQMVIRLNGKPVCIPLSAGYDSRLILAMLKKLKYDNIWCFFYGAPGNANWERKYSLDTAKKLKVPWTHVSYNRGYVRDCFKSCLWKEYGKYADNLCSVPSYIYLFYMKWLDENNLLKEDTVIINGQSGDFTSGNHLFELITRPPISRESIYNAIIDKHFSLWLNLKTPDNIKRIKLSIDKVTTNVFGYNGLSSQSAASMLDYWEWNERQTKYVINGQRVYDFYRIKWELPFWEDDYLHFWKTIPWNMKLNQKFFIKFMTEVNLFGLFKDFQPKISIPLSKRSISLPFYFLTRFFAQWKRDQLVQKYLRYFVYPNKFYSIITYSEYLKTSAYHRSPVSYFCLKHLQEQEIEDGKPIFLE